MKKSFSFFDFDNTLYKGKNRYLILDFPEYLESKGYFRSQALKDLNGLQNTYIQGNINRDDFAISVIRTYYLGLLGQCEKIINTSAENFWETHSSQCWFEYSLPLIELMSKFTTTVLISGSPFEILRYIYKTIGIRKVYATKGIVSGGFYTAPNPT
jgi:phosphoserine phosphatase